MNWNSTRIAASALILGAALTGCVDRQAQAQGKKISDVVTNQTRNVKVMEAALEDIQETLEITGDLTSGLDSTVNAKTPGQVVAVYVKDGDSVSAGQTIATLDTSTLQAQLQQATAQVRAAEAQSAGALVALTQARRNATVGPARTRAGVRSAEAQLRGAQSQLQKAINGAQTEERKQALSSQASAKSNLDTQEKELERVKKLVEEGAIAGNRLDQQQNAYQAALSQYQTATEAVAILQRGTREEDLLSARESVKQAEEGLRTAKVAQDLDPLLTDSIKAAQAQLENTYALAASARANVNLVMQNMRDASIKAPFSGRISGKPIQAGAVASGGTPVARIIGNEGVYFEGEIPMSAFNRVQSGQTVDVKVEALGNRVIKGIIASINPVAESIGRSFKTRIQLTGAIGDVKPGMFARGSILLRKVDSASLLPLSAVLTDGEKSYVFVVEKLKSKKVFVTVGLTKGARVQVIGLATGSQVITSGQEGMVDGLSVKVEANEKTTAQLSTEQRGG